MERSGGRNVQIPRHRDECIQHWLEARLGRRLRRLGEEKRGGGRRVCTSTTRSNSMLAEHEYAGGLQQALTSRSQDNSRAEEIERKFTWQHAVDHSCFFRHDIAGVVGGLEHREPSQCQE